MNIPGEVGLILGLLGIVIAVSIAYIQRRPKRLDYKVVEDRTFLTDNPKLQSRQELSLIWRGKRVENPRLVALRLANTGKVPIRRDDFDGRRLAVEWAAHDVQVMDVSIAELYPAELTVTIRKDEEPAPRILIDPCLLNPGDWFEIQAVTDQAESDLSVRGRIAGVKRIRDMGNVQTRKQAAWILTLLVLAFLLLAALVTHIVISEGVATLLMVLVATGIFYLGLAGAYRLLRRLNRTSPTKPF